MNKIKEEEKRLTYNKKESIAEQKKREQDILLEKEMEKKKIQS